MCDDYVLSVVGWCLVRRLANWGLFSQNVLKFGKGACPIGRVSAGDLEAAVINQLRTVFRQPEIIAGTWKAARAHDASVTEADATAALQRLDPLWDELFPAEQARIVVLLVERVDIGTTGLNVRLRVDGLSGLAQELCAKVGEAARLPAKFIAC